MFTAINPPDPVEFAGKRVVVTGGSRGLGAAIAQRLLDGGAVVVVTARSRTDETPDGATFIPGDVSSVQGVQAFAAAALDGLGGVDILINNAGAARVHLQGIASIPDEEWVDSLNLNYLSALRVTSAFLAVLHEAGPGGSVVNISSGTAIVPAPPMAHYSAAKAALNAYGKALAAELAPAGIRVATISPGNVVSPGADVVRQDLADAFGTPIEDAAATVPLGRLGDPCDVAEAVAYLASPRAQWVTGVNMYVDGGELPSF